MLAAALFAFTATAPAASEFFVFDNGVGRGKWTPEQQATTLKSLGYDGISYNYTNNKDLADWLKVCKAHDLKIYGLYVSTSPDNPQHYDPQFKAAIKMLKGSDTIIWMTLQKPTSKGDHDAEAVKIVREIAGLAAEQGLRVAIYPHFGFCVATAADGLRIAKLSNLPNVGATLNLCHEFLTGNGGRLDETIKAVASYCTLVSINGLEVAGKTMDKLILRLDQGDFDLAGYLKKLRDAGYHGPIGLQCYNVKGDVLENLKADIAAWRRIDGQLDKP
jgi:sugar phosphate isomerase/epimerase